MTRLAHISDIHFGGENAPAVAAAAALVNESGLDLVVLTGDLTRYGEPQEFGAAADWLKLLRPPVLSTPGNHDAPYLDWSQRLFTPFRRYESAIGPAQSQNFQGAELAVHGLNTARGPQPRLNWSKGQIARAQVDRAVAWFADQPAGAIRILACHHPLVEMVGGPMTARVWGGEAAARRLSEEAEVDLVLSGHIHAPFTWPYAFGDGRTYAVGAGTLSIRERGVPPSFNIVDIEGAEIRISALSWTGSHYEPYRTWSVDRRAS